MVAVKRRPNRPQPAPTEDPAPPKLSAHWVPHLFVPSQPFALTSLLIYIGVFVWRALMPNTTPLTEAPKLLPEPAKNVGSKRIATQHKRTKKRRAQRRKESRIDFITLYNAIYELDLPESWRETLAAHLPSFNRSSQPWEPRKWMKYRRIKSTVANPIDWSYRAIWKRLFVEKNRKVRYALLCVADRFVTRVNAWHIWAPVQDDATEFLIDVLAEEEGYGIENLRYDEREVAFNILQAMMEHRGERDSWGGRVAAIWLRLVEHHRTKNAFSKRLWRNAAECMWYFVLWDDELTSRLIACPYTLPFLFEAIATEGPVDYSLERDMNRVTLQERLSMLLSLILDHASPEESTDTIARFETQLRETFPLMFVWDLNRLVEYQEFAEIFATCPTLLESVWKSLKYDDAKRSAVKFFWCILHSALNDDTVLTALLSRGYLGVAHHIAMGDVRSEMFMYGTNGKAALFRSILALHPEWKRYFKQITCDGEANNATADMGRAMILRRSRSAEYLLIDYEDL